MEQKLSDTLVKAIDRSNPMMQNLQLASRFNKLVEQSVDLEDNKEVSITENGTVEITPTEGKDGMKKVTANVNVPSGATDLIFNVRCISLTDNYILAITFPRSNKVTDINVHWIAYGGNTFDTHYDFNENGYVVTEQTSEANTKVSVVYDGDTYSYTYTGRDYEQHDLVKE